MSAGNIEDGEYDWMNLNGGLDRKVMGINSSAAQQAHHSNIHRNHPTANITHDQFGKRYAPNKYQCLFEPLPNPEAARLVPGRNQVQAVSCQAQFQDSLSNLNQIQYRAIPLQSPNAQRLRRQEPQMKCSM
jgi:hypothetical protein